MFNDLLKLVQASGLESVVNNPAVPNEHNEGVLQAASTSVIDTLKGMMANGQGAEIAQLANNSSHPATQMMQREFVENIMQKFGISGDAAKNIAGSLLPQVMAQLSKTDLVNGENFDLGAIGSMLGKTGLDKDGDGDVDLKDVTKMFGF